MQSQSEFTIVTAAELHCRGPATLLGNPGMLLGGPAGQRPDVAVVGQPEGELQGEAVPYLQQQVEMADLGVVGGVSDPAMPQSGEEGVLVILHVTEELVDKGLLIGIEAPLDHPEGSVAVVVDAGPVHADEEP